MRFWGPSKADLELDDIVRSTAKQATQFETIALEQRQMVSVIGTRFGGVPYAEAGEKWPMNGHRPYDFVAQFNFNDGITRPIDAYDLITVFLSWYEVESPEANFENVCVIRTYRTPAADKAVVMPRPKMTTHEDFRVLPCAVQARNVTTYPSPVSTYLKVPAIRQSAKSHKNFGKAYLKSLKRLGYKWQDEHTQIGGYPTWVHEDTFGTDDLIFIVQIAHEPLANFCIGDAAPLFIAASRADPTKFKVDPWQTH